MIKTVEEGLARYKKVLATYLKKSERLKEKHGKDWLSYPGDDYRWLMEADARLDGMAKALGLNKKEEKKIINEIKASLIKKA